MLKRRKNLPLDYSLCAQTVTVYRGAAREVLRNVHFECADRREEAGGVAGADRGFLMIVPGGIALAPGDMAVEGIGPEITRREDLKTESLPGLCLVRSVRQCYYKGSLCHTEVRG